MDELKTPRSHGPGPSQSSVHRWGHLFRHHRIRCVQTGQKIRAVGANLVGCGTDAVPVRGLTDMASVGARSRTLCMGISQVELSMLAAPANTCQWESNV